MRLAPRAMDRIEHAGKRLELRLYDVKRQQLQIGDEVCFTEAGDEQRTLRVTVTGLLHYPDFAALTADVPPRWLGYPGASRYSAEGLARAMGEVYAPGQVRQHGVLGILFRLEGVAR